ncbi:dihydrodipicolinate synthase family protein [Tatumella citrea]|uniref:Dihydrodipicolinate synthase family protein n=1 Tax=Tatumella citrea TaxID=53336 RepID=A0A1Y0LF98_TATCI|nr:dihydrodipicolinate synthase family protein [Tatumella citrea]ARU92725.1 dihydrodipicolinate synthase family protein [Tatumella citrea]ARU96763.1 dihydrodipicolinate synthase family protein [Tatumella citrea]
MKAIEGIVPVMLTPFTADNQVDYPGLARLIDWYLAQGVDALFAVCQSSEMQFLSLEERVELAEFVVRQVDGRIPVIASGHISDDLAAQKAELSAMAETGIDALVLVTNHLDPQQQGTEVFMSNLQQLLDTLPASVPLGLYECPAPYRRLLSDEEFSFCANSGRFVVLKDVSCDLPTVKRRVALAEGTPLNIINANAAIAWPAIQAGSRGFSGVFTNFHPALYVWLYHHGAKHQALADELAIFLSLAAVTETLGYPKNAKIWHQRLETFSSPHCRVTKDNVLEKYWGLEVILDQIWRGTAQWQQRITQQGSH